MIARRPLADYLRAEQINNFSIDGDVVRIGGMAWVARECACGMRYCDDWEMTPVHLASAMPIS